jgi:hypothetical protein
MDYYPRAPGVNQMLPPLPTGARLTPTLFSAFGFLDSATSAGNLSALDVRGYRFSLRKIQKVTLSSKSIRFRQVPSVNDFIRQIVTKAGPDQR